MRTSAYVMFLCCAALPGLPLSAGLVPNRLRCEYLINPLGVDVGQPRLSWVVEARPPQRGQRQSAYQIVVATTPEKLDTAPDLWNSGKVRSDETAQVPYQGQPMSSGLRCYWKVRVWDAAGRPSDWSEPAMWSAGLLRKSDWGAKWIFDPAAVPAPDAESNARRAAHNGYQSRPALSPETAKWVAVDLGAARTIDSIRLYAAQFEPGGPAYHFPLRFRIEVAGNPDFADAKTVVDRTAQDEPSPVSGNAPEYRFSPVAARYVRLSAVRLRRHNEVIHSLALAEMQVLAGGANVAAGRTVTSLDSVETGGWSRANLVDGRTTAAAADAVIQPGSMFRKSFSIAGAVKRATVYATARGIYELRINGRRVGDHILAPEWTDYRKRIQYQAYDVTALLRTGNNAIGALLAAGWYSGRIGLLRRQMYGGQPQFLMRLDIELADGRRQTVVTDETWRELREPPLVSADILDGETWDARKEVPGWDAPGLDDRTWPHASAEADPGEAELVWQRNEPIRVVKELTPVRVTEPLPGRFIVDLGQNMVGWCRLKLRGRAGETVTIRYGEALSDDGTLYINNLRTAPQVDRYTLRSSDDEVFEPRFTYHGFRFVEITGLKGRPARNSVTGRVFHSSSPEAGRFETSSSFVNQLMSNIVWTQRANLESTPTDCPQRDERLGWMGDFQTFSQTAIFNLDMAGFLSKWIRDTRDDQLADGRFPNFAPHPNAGVTVDQFFGAPGWADAGVIVPWRAYQNYGDRRVLEEQFESASRYVEYVRSQSPNFIWEKGRGNDYGDWLNADTLIKEGWPRTGGAIPKPIFATAFFAHSADIVAKMAAVLGKKEEEARYRELFERIKEAFNRTWVKPDGQIESGTQSAYALALHFNLLPDGIRLAALHHMIAGFDRYGGHLSTGIHSSNRLMLELARFGRAGEAYRMLLLKSFPSWGFMIENGATTIWERWDGYVKGRGFQSPGMNSLNHWALGAVGEWMWRVIAGINPDEKAPGYKHFIVRPLPGGGLTWASGTYESIRGTIRVAWKIEGDSIALNCSVPANTSATVYVPTADPKSVTEGGRPARNSSGLTFVSDEQSASVFRVGGGEYTFRARFDGAGQPGPGRNAP